MKTKNNLLGRIGLITILFLSLTWTLQAQQNKKGQGTEKGNCMGQSCLNLPNLSQDQKDKIDALRIPHMKEMQQLQNKLRENKAHLKTLESADKPNMADINATIDIIGDLKVSMMKSQAAHKQAIRQLLTDEQKVVFDAQRNGMHRPGPHYGNYEGYGQQKSGSCQQGK